MSLTRREFLTRAAAGGAGAVLLPSIVGRVGPAFGSAAVDPATAGRNRLVVIFLVGGNDGLNYVIPTGDVSGAPRYSVYKKVRPSLAYAPSSTLALDRPGDVDQALGFNQKLSTLHRFYGDGRVAIVQGVDYPKHNYSHFASVDIWHSGEPDRTPNSGWLGRHLDRVHVGDGELRAAAVGTQLPLLFQGRSTSGVAIASIAATKFADGTGALANARHRALAGFHGDWSGEPIRAVAARVGATTVDVVDELSRAAAPPTTGEAFTDSLITARFLLEQNLGVECVYVAQPGYDTHAGQRAQQEQLLTTLDTALETFWLGTAHGAAVGNLGPLAPNVASRTLVMIVSEFGRRIGETGAASVAGTDHGAAAPLVLLGPPAAADAKTLLVPGLHGDHPNMGSVTAPADNLTMTTDLRSVYGAVLQSWLSDPDPMYDRSALPGLFTTASATAASSAKTTPERIRVSGAAASSAAASAPPSGDAAAGRSSRVPEDAVVRIHERGGKHGLNPVSATAAVAFDVLIALLLIRSGKLRELKDKLQTWRADTPS